MGLLALATDDEQVHVFRTDGQRVFGVTRKNPTSKVTGIKWKPDGQSLAVAFDRLTCIASALTGRIMYEKASPAVDKGLICCLGWATNFTDAANVRETVSNFDDSPTLDEFIASARTAGNSKHVPSLSVDLAFIDVASTLPKLSVLPMGDSRGDIFNSRALLDTLFKPLSTDSAASVNVLVVGHEDGKIGLSMSEDFSIGTFDLHDAASNLSDSRPLLHCSHPMSTTHALLVSNGLQELHVVPFDLRMISTAGRYLSLLASKVTELHNLLRYLHQVQEHICSEIRTSQDLPSRFMRNIDEALQEKSDCTWVQAAYHLVVTGHCYPEVKEWLVDELGERGHKRWDKAVNTGYETIRRLTHESLLPALERLCVLLSRLRGLSRFQSSDVLLGLSTLELDDMLDSTNCLQLLSYRLLKCVISESKQFGAFSTWLRHEIEKQAADPNSATAQEMAEKDPSFDYPSILAYIEGVMMQSRMLTYLGSPEEDQSQWNLDAEGRALFELYKRKLSDESKSIRPQKQLPGLRRLLRHLEAQSELAFDRISQTQQRNVQFGVPISLSTGASDCIDMRMVVESEKRRGPLIQAVIKMFRITLVVEGGVSSTKKVQYDNIAVPAGALRDVKFIDDETLALAFSDQKSAPRLLKVNYRLKGRSGRALFSQESLPTNKENEVDPGSIPQRTGIDLTDPNDVTIHTMHRFPTGKMWIPQRLETNGQRGMRTICVVAEDRVHVRQFDIDIREEANAAGRSEADVAMSTF
ncbi:MAG: hypothetical protein Q9216_000777 [Gyalolechia sp. 2 TL-2023]